MPLSGSSSARRHQGELDEALAAVSGLPGSLDGMTADAASREDVDRVFDTVDAKLGGIDILVACAALGAQLIHEMDEDDWRYVVETNLIGYLACARRAILRMEAHGSGHLLFVGSISTEIKAEGESVYSATKAGIQAFAETLRKEVAEKNIKVSVIQRARSRRRCRNVATTTKAARSQTTRCSMPRKSPRRSTLR